MNYIRTKVNTVSVFFGLLFFIIFSVQAERPINIKELGTPIVQKFPFPNFSLLSGKFSVYEDPYGVFLIGAQDKMIVFYGNEFVTIKLEGQINISSNQKSVFYTGYNS